MAENCLVSSDLSFLGIDILKNFKKPVTCMQSVSMKVNGFV